jgi:hypothetical protein
MPVEWALIAHLRTGTNTGKCSFSGRVVREPALHVEAHCGASIDKGDHGTCFLQVAGDPSIQGMYVGSAQWGQKPQHRRDPVAAVPDQEKSGCVIPVTSHQQANRYAASDG